MEVKINREIRNYTEAMFFGLSMRQFIFSACACVVAVGLYFLLKSYVSKKGLFLGDKKAEEIWEAAGFTLKGKSKSKWLAYYMGIRSAVFDEWLNQRMTDLQDAVIIHIGCGMDSRIIRIGTDNHKWYDVDFAGVITERRKYYSESEHYQMIAGDRELVWFECGMPKQFSYCQMLIDEDNDNGLVLVDFSFRPVDVLSSITCWLLNARRQDKKDVDVYYKFLLRYIMIYPIAAACSVKVKDRNTKFVEEYVFPQLFMQWIRETDEFDGVRYKSSLNTSLVDGMGAINIALPVKEYRADGLDRRLAEKITVSDIGYLDVNCDFQKYNDILEKIKDYINGIQMFMNQVPFYGDYMIELTDVCKCVIKTYNALMEGNYQNSELIFSYLDLPYDHANLLYANRDFKIQECINKTEEHHRQPIDEEKIKEQFEEFHQLMNQILHKHAVFDFRFENMGNYENL
mgnify:CR=1 FL=1